MDGEFLIIGAFLVAVLVAERMSGAQEQKRARYQERAQAAIDDNESERIRAAIVSRVRDTELPIAEEAFHAAR